KLVRHSQRDIDADEHRLVGRRVEECADPGASVEALGDEPVERVRDASGEEDPKGSAVTSGHYQPNRNRYQKKARQRDQVRQVELQRAHHDGPDAILAMSRRKRVQPEEVLRTITSVIVGSGA